MNKNLNYDFVVNKDNNTIKISQNFQPIYHWCGMPIQKVKYWTNSGHQNHGRLAQRKWILEKEVYDFMPW